jgi:hypothetical protein
VKLAVLVPHKDREVYQQFQRQYLTTYLKEQGISHNIVFCEQQNNELFNKSKTLNVAFQFAYNNYNPDYIIVNDVDIVPLTLNYSYNNIAEVWFGDAGGVKLLSSDFIRVNGYNPNFKGWGYEDSEFWHRLHINNIENKKWSEHVVHAEMINLEMSETDSLVASQEYFGRANPPRFFAPWENELTSHITIKHPRTWDTPDNRKQNAELCDRVKLLPKTEAIKYFSENGLSQVASTPSIVVSETDTVAEIYWQ